MPCKVLLVKAIISLKIHSFRFFCFNNAIIYYRTTSFHYKIDHLLHYIDFFWLNILKVHNIHYVIYCVLRSLLKFQCLNFPWFEIDFQLIITTFNLGNTFLVQIAVICFFEFKPCLYVT